MLSKLYQQDCDVAIIGLDGNSVKCHKNILIQASSYFEALFDFKDTFSIRLEYDLPIINSMIEFLYLGRTSINSAYLIDLLELSHQCLMYSLKFSIENMLA